MSFFGLSSAGKDAKGQLSEIPNWFKGQMTQNFGRGDEAYNFAQGNRDQYAAYLKDAIDKGYASPADIRAAGEMAIPGVSDAISRANGRWDQIAQSYGDVPSAGYTSDNTFQNLDLGNQMNQSNFDRQRDTISSGFGSAYGRGDTAFNDLGSSIRQSGAKNDSTFGDLRGSSGSTFGRLNKNSDDLYNNLISADNGSDATYADLAKGNAGAYGKASANVERLLPGGDLAAAKAARAYAPEMVSTMGRIRASGVDPNSPQAQSIIQAAERDRARGMDDSLSSSLKDYVGAGNALTLGQESRRGDLALSGLGNRQNLAREGQQNSQGLQLSGLSNDQGLSLAQLNDDQTLNGEYRGDIRSKSATDRNLDLSRTAADMGNNDVAYQRGAGNIADRNAALLSSRGMSLQDWQNKANILQGQNTNDLTSLGLQKQQYDTGNQWTGNNLQQKNWAASGTGDLAQRQYNNGMQFQNNGMNAGNSALQGYGNAYGTEAANAGWGTKMLVGAGLAAASMIPGVGPAIGKIGGAAMNGGGFGQQQGGYGGLQTPPTFPKFRFGRGGGDYSATDISNGWGSGG